MEAQKHKIIIAQFDKTMSTETVYQDFYEPRSISTDTPPPLLTGYISHDITEKTPTACFLADEEKFCEFLDYLDTIDLQLDEIYIYDRYTLDGEDMVKRASAWSKYFESIELHDEHKHKWWNGEVLGCKLFNEFAGFTPDWKLMPDVTIQLSDGTFEPLRIDDYVSKKPAYFFDSDSAKNYAIRNKLTNYKIIETW